MKRDAIARVAVVVVLAILIGAGGVGLYYYTSLPSPKTTTTTSETSSTSQTAEVGPAGGSQDANGQPQGVWADYLGYLPAGYVLAPHYVNSYTYPCPSGMDASQCALFSKSCGNGVCDPNESCTTCPSDCGIAGALTCDPYTGRAGAPLSICEVNVGGQG
jgi:hypothetical protein